VGLTTPHRKKQIRYGKLHKTSDLDGFFGRTTQAKEYGHDIWNLVCKELSSYIHEIIGDVTDQLLTRFSAFFRYWRKSGSAMRQYISYS
jgi:hypothetical protein